MVCYGNAYHPNESRPVFGLLAASWWGWTVVGQRVNAVDTRVVIDGWHRDHMRGPAEHPC